MTEIEADVVVLGAGVGGAMLALALGRAGVRVLLAEPGPQIPGRGAEILKPRGIRVLRDYGVLPQLLRHGALCRDLIRYSHDGQPLFDLDFTDHSELGYFLTAPYRSIVASVLDAAAAQPSIRVEFDAAVAGIEAHDTRYHVTFHDGQTARARVLVGADGPRSPVLAHLGVDLTARTYDHVVQAASLATPQAAGHGNELYFSSSGSFAYVYPLDAATMRVFVGLPPALVAELGAASGEFLVEHLRSFVPDHAHLSRLARAVWQTVPVGAWQSPRLARDGTVVLGHAAFSAHPMTGLGMSVTLEDAIVLADAITQALAGQHPAYTLIAERYQARQDVHRRLINYGDALATTYPNPTEYRRQFRTRMHCGD